MEHFFKDYEDNNIRNQYILNDKFFQSQVFYKYKTIFLHAMDKDGNTYLHLAAVGNQTVCELLLKYDAEIITLLNRKNKTARDIPQDNSHSNMSMH